MCAVNSPDDVKSAKFCSYFKKRDEEQKSTR